MPSPDRRCPSLLLRYTSTLSIRFIVTESVSTYGTGTGLGVQDAALNKMPALEQLAW